ncbi:MAG: hypothetical protein JWM88_865 [Verrucomicrobia bacterium]|nr:hypothetical protein [Verrucomicrobiota bacterium]
MNSDASPNLKSYRGAGGGKGVRGWKNKTPRPAARGVEKEKSGVDYFAKTYFAVCALAREAALR